VTENKFIRERLELLAIKIADYLCTFHMENGEKFSCSKTLKEVQEELSPNFLLISRNCIINVEKIKLIDVRKREIELPDRLIFKYSYRKAKRLKDMLKTDILRSPVKPDVHGKKTYVHELCLTF
jgi:DNA-binding LytR/AlgR family response regulator